MHQLIFKQRKLMALSAFIATIIPVFIGLKSGACRPNTYITTGFGNNQFGTKTAYFWTYPESEHVKNKLMKITMDGRTCNAVHVNLVSRHGARYTSVRDMRSFTALQQKLKHNFTNQTYDFINNWVNRYPEEKETLISALGEREMAYLGTHFGTELHDLLNGTVSTDGTPTSVQFAATRKTRTQESAKYFFRGLTDVLLGQNLTSVKPSIRDNILRFFDNCKRYEQETADLSEQAKFESGPIFQKVVTDITERLGTNVSLTVGDVKMIYRLCATELAIRNNADWCSLLTDADRDVLEYDNDIKDCITRWYEHKITGQMSCPFGKDIFTSMDKAIAGNDQGSSYTKGMFQFGHSDTITDLAAGFGLFNDWDSLRADNYYAMQNRKCRASILDPFSTHFAFVLYNCGGAGIDSYALKLFFNGKSISIPKCNSEACWYKDVRLGYKQFIDGCDLDSICAVQHTPDIIG
ncbi:multiple inositol polyphosphate phosphatase 1-like [Mercenaria mercenaria]|uniref:multiple inositol polyphosphate phosphatase 1-like n=1 Tax=Mercenaria mercenaria TaxID=6596 RepID=UPI00234F6EC0|nr:multiple inositol polyphosphate phosphatase 1-like [Mercenaria mercenaria]